MKNAIILHGLYDKNEYHDSRYPSPSNAHWLPWLQRQLQLQGIKADTPEVFLTYKAGWSDWVKEIERYEIGPHTILVGHSMGGGFWIRYLSQKKNLMVGKVILVAPWMDPDGDETDGFFEDFQVDPDIARRTAGLSIFHSDNDMGNVHKSVANLREHIKGMDYREFHGYGHFCYGDMKTHAFPELLEACLS